METVSNTHATSYLLLPPKKKRNVCATSATPSAAYSMLTADCPGLVVLAYL